MDGRLYLFLAEGVAAATSSYRPGARHAMLIYVLDHSVDAARPVALAEARGHSWEHVAIKREKALSLDVELIENVTLRTAAEAALADGAAIVVYRDEIPPDS